MPHASRFAAAALILATLAANSGALAYGERDPAYASAVVKENGFCSGSPIAFERRRRRRSLCRVGEGLGGASRNSVRWLRRHRVGDRGRVVGVGAPMVRTPDGGLLVSQATSEGQRFLAFRAMGASTARTAPRA
jgi:hypothetical protein